MLHVIDCSDPNLEDHIKIVHNILSELELEKDILYVFNKSDKINVDDDIKPMLEKYTPNVLTSALTKDGLKPLTEYISKFIKQKKQ